MGLVIAILALITCNQSRELARVDRLNNAYRDSVAYQHTQLDSFKNKLGQVITEARLVRTQDERTIQKLSEDVFHLQKKDEAHIKAYQALYRVKQTVRIDSVPVPYIDSNSTAGIDTAGLVRADQVIIPPRTFYDSTAHYTVRGRVLLEGVALDVVRVPDTVSLRVVEVKKGLFKRRETVVQTIHSNPLVKTEGQQSISVTPKKSFIEKILPKLALVAGIYLGTKL